MKKTISLLLVLVLLLSVGGVQALAAGTDPEEIVGVYRLIAMDDGSGDDNTETLEMMAALGMLATLTVEEDGSAVIDLFGDTLELSFDFEAGTAGADGANIPYAYEDGVLTMTNDEYAFTFSKSTPETEKGVGPFDLYVLVGMVNADGEDITDSLEALADQDEFTTLTVFRAGDAVIDIFGEVTALTFDFEEGTVVIEGESEASTFTVDDDLMTIVDEDGTTMYFLLTDPGRVGPYEMSAMISEDDGDMTEQLQLLSALGMAPTLVIEEDGSAVISMFGEELELFFDFDKMTVTVEDETVPFTYENGTIVLEEDGELMSFSRVMPAAEDAKD